MNRRNLVIAGATSLALIRNQASAQRSSFGSTVVTSTLTGAEIDFAASGFALGNQEFVENMGFERITLETDSGLAIIELFPMGMQYLPGYVESFVESSRMLYTDFQLLGENMAAGGGWTAFSYFSGSDFRGHYYEYQEGAFPEVDMVIMFSANADTFQDEFARMQSIDLGGEAPFLFTEDSQVETMTFISASSTGNGSRSTRTSRNAESTDASETSQNSRAGTSSDSATGDADFIEAITDYREAFLESFATFNDHLASTENATEQETSDTFLIMVNIALEWQAYPQFSEEMAVPTGMEGLGEIFADWCFHIGKMGHLFEQLFMGTDTVDDFIATMTAWEKIDTKLATELDRAAGSNSLPTFFDISVTAKLMCVPLSRLDIVHSRTA